MCRCGGTKPRFGQVGPGGGRFKPGGGSPGPRLGGTGAGSGETLWRGREGEDRDTSSSVSRDASSSVSKTVSSSVSGMPPRPFLGDDGDGPVQSSTLPGSTVPWHPCFNFRLKNHLFPSSFTQNVNPGGQGPLGAGWESLTSGGARFGDRRLPPKPPFVDSGRYGHGSAA